ncbi:hypothetical protein HCU01_20020 [Halomonas cupida]|uniref:Uncharacterized protein n=2 Tax=Halomonas cupida TaxID=44933 RepID=A0A1M7I794_9GAMM|nr:hypothetical protein HCU01_20020 [Halomonas cupida]SHM36555.1 hypothetical protein SAMN05660971_02842 [Halomonas cupida]
MGVYSVGISIPPELPDMIKALSICFTVLLVQLAALHWVDKRTNNTSPSEARNVATVVTQTSREDDDSSQPLTSGQDTSGSA